MSQKPLSSIGSFSSGSTVTHVTKNGKFDFTERKQGATTVYLDRQGRQLGRVDAVGRTITPGGKILNLQPRPDLLLNQPRKR